VVINNDFGDLTTKVANFSSQPWPNRHKLIMTLATTHIMTKVVNLSSHLWQNHWKSIMTLVTAQLLTKVANFSSHPWPNCWNSIMTLATALLQKLSTFLPTQVTTVSNRQS